MCTWTGSLPIFHFLWALMVSMAVAWSPHNQLLESYVLRSDSALEAWTWELSSPLFASAGFHSHPEQPT